jgi:uncharacterized protein YcbX
MSDDATTAPEPPAGTITELWRFPVKSMQGERIHSGELTSKGFVGDRRYGVRLADSGQVLTAKRDGDLLNASARTEADGSVVLTLPDGTELAADDPAVHAALSDWLGRSCRLEPPAETGAEFEMSFDAEHPDENTFVWPCAPGTYLDLAGAHVLTTASIAAARALHPDGDWDVRRFRPTAVVDTGDADGFVEDAWVGGDVQLGGAVLRVDMPTVRCPMPTRPQPGGIERDFGVAHTLRDHHDNNLGIYCTVTTAGTVAVGDPLVVA